MTYEIIVTSRARRALRRIQPSDRNRVVAAIDGLSVDPRPHGCEKLAGFTETYRIRVGAFRIAYEIDEAVVRIVIVMVGHPRDIYRDL